MQKNYKDVISRSFLITFIPLVCGNLSHAECVVSEHKDAKLMTCNYERYAVIVSCKYRMALLSSLSINSDIGNSITSNRRYYLDPQASSLNCQQTSSKQYSKVNSDYDVGHLTAIDHLDDDIHAALQTNAMTNLVPQNKVMNRYGAWKRTETLVECYRDDITEQNGMDVLSGVIIGSSIENDHFENTHGLLSTPDYMWKVVYFRNENQYDAWIIPNTNSALASNISDYRKSLEKIIDELIKDNKSEHKFSVLKLGNIQQKKPTNFEMIYDRKCKHRIG